MLQQATDVDAVGSVGEMTVGTDEDQARAVRSAEGQAPKRDTLDVVERTRLGLPGDAVNHDQAGTSLGEVVERVIGPVGRFAGEQ